MLTRKDALESVLNEIPAVDAVKKGNATQSSENFATVPYIVCSHPDLDLVLKEIIKIVNITGYHH